MSLFHKLFARLANIAESNCSGSALVAYAILAEMLVKEILGELL